MSSINKVIMCGHVVRDPMLKTAGQSQVCTITIATNHTIRKQGQEPTRGEPKEEVCYIDIETWGVTAQKAAASLRKGSLIAAEGRLKFQTWKDKTTQEPRYKHIIFCENLIFNFEDTPTKQEPQAREPQTQVSQTQVSQTQVSQLRPTQSPMNGAPTRTPIQREAAPKVNYQAFEDEDLPF